MFEDQQLPKRLSFREKLGGRKPLIGTLISLPVPAVSEVLSRLGFDWLWIDMEHAPLSLEQVQYLLQSTAPTCSGLVRVPANDQTWIKQILDLGADGIIVPQVKTRQDAEAAVKAAKYPPVGNRSMGIARAHAYGADFVRYIEMADISTAVVLQIEHKEAVHNISQILQVEGIDAIMIGPYDLSGSYDKLGQISDSEVQGAIQSVKDVCLRNGMPCGIFSLNAEAAANLIMQGFQLIAQGIDIHYLWTGAKAALDTIQAV